MYPPAIRCNGEQWVCETLPNVGFWEEHAVESDAATVRLNRDQVGAEAINLAIALAEDPTQDVPPVVLPVSLIHRTSAGTRP